MKKKTLDLVDKH